LAEIVKIHGLRELQRAMRELPRRMDRRILNAALMAGARPMVADAKANVLVDTGALRSAIRATPLRKTSHTSTVQIGIGRARQTKAQRMAGAKRYVPFYGLFLEFGTSKMSAKPFLRPAFERNKRSAVEIIRERIATRIAAEAEKLRRK
jgi:HK97 gp10 family phage protein